MKKMDKNSMRFLTKALIVMSLLLAAITCAKAIKYKIETGEVPEKIKAAISAAVQNDDEIKELQKRFTAAAGNLKKKSIFAPPPPGKKNPVKKVDAIMGAEAYINNKWYKVGDSIGDAKLISVEAAQITVEWNGKETKLSPISAPTEYAVVPKAKPEETVKAVEEKTVEPVAPVPEEVKPVAASVEEDPLAWMGVKMSPALRAKFLEKWNQMTDEQKEQGKKQWNSMPDGQKQAMVDQMEEHIDEM